LDLEIQLAAVGSDSKEKLRMFEVCGDPNSNDGAIEESGQPFRCAIPKHPGALMPSPGALSSAYQVAAAEIYGLRNVDQRLDTYAGAMQDAAFNAFLSALSKACSAIVGEQHSDWGERYPAQHDIYVVASGPMRGRGRALDEHGVCAAQKLVVTGDLVRLVKYRRQLFPGAKLSIEPAVSKTTLLQKLIYVLADAGEADEISTKIIAERLGDTWRNISGNLSKTKGWKDVTEGIGWTYHGGSGSRPGCFRRDTGALVVTTERRRAMARIASLVRQRASSLHGDEAVRDVDLQRG
jgi:hypothetical protein